MQAIVQKGGGAAEGTPQYHTCCKSLTDFLHVLIAERDVARHAKGPHQLHCPQLRRIGLHLALNPFVCTAHKPPPARPTAHTKNAYHTSETQPSDPRRASQLSQPPRDHSHSQLIPHARAPHS